MFLVVFSFFLFFLNCITSNLVIWWSVFLILTMVYLFVCKPGGYSSSLNYFIVQEFLGLLFVLSSSCMLQFFIVLIKSGVSPLHFWVFSCTKGVRGFGLVWFLTFQKLPFLPVLEVLMFSGVFVVILFGILVCLFQVFSLKSFGSMLVVSSTESFGWCLFILFSYFYCGVVFYILYFVIVFFFFGYSSSFDIDFYNWEAVLTFMNFPFTISFFMKVFSIFSFLEHSSFFILFVLFVLFCSSLSFGFWFLNLSSKYFYLGFSGFKFCLFLTYPLFFFFIF